MKIDIRPNLDQIRFFAQSAKRAWDFQDSDHAREQVIADMTSLLRYIDVCERVGADRCIYGLDESDGNLRLEIKREGRPIVLPDKWD